jgi:hypothetical protein
MPPAARERSKGHRAYLFGVPLLSLTILAFGGPASATDATAASPAPLAALASPVAAETSPSPVTAVQDIVIEVHRAPNCGCCTGWEAYIEDQGFAVESWEDPGLTEFKMTSGVPSTAMSCHTAIVDGYIVEGHVPVEAILDLLEQRPEIDGIALPGMPPGSPGMPGEKTAPFEILAFVDGATTVFGEY